MAFCETSLRTCEEQILSGVPNHCQSEGGAIADGFLGLDWEAVARARDVEDRTRVRHRYALRPNPPGPGEPATVLVGVPPGISVTGGRVVFTTDGSVPDDTSETVELRPGDPAGVWEATLPPQPEQTRVRYRITVHRDGEDEPVADAGPAFEFPLSGVVYVRPPDVGFSYVVGRPRVPDWVPDAAIYHVLVDRFAPPLGGFPPDADLPPLGFVGGTIRGLTERLDHIASIGCDTLLISPIFPADMHVCYDHHDLFGVEPRLGDLDDARALCAAAHDRGMRVLLDLVAVYFGQHHPFVARARRDPGGPYGRWFHRQGDRFYGWFGATRLVTVDHRNDEVRAHLLDAVRFWLDVGFDGFRLDSAHFGSLDFWTELGDVLRREAPDAFTIAEVMRSHAECATFRGRLHGYFDFGTCDALRGFAGRGDLSASAFDARIAELDRIPDGLVAPAFLDNHDMDRFEAVADGDTRRLRLGLLLLFTLPGLPILYYGTEVGVPQGRRGELDPGTRFPMRWGDDQDAELLAFVRELGSMRRRHPALRRGTRRTLYVRDPGLYAFERMHEDDRVIVAANANPDAYVFDVPLDVPDGTRFEAPGAGTVTARAGRLPLALGPMEAITLTEVHA